MRLLEISRSVAVVGVCVSVRCLWVTEFGPGDLSCSSSV